MLLLRVPLPLASHRQRQAAAGFAVEDLVAEPIEALHVALGPELAAGEYLVGVIRETDLAPWAAEAAGSARPLVPDTLSLPVPAEGAWSVRETAGRALARLPDGTGFATALAGFETFWNAGGRPQLVLFGGRLPASVPVAATALLPAGTGRSDGFDLLRGYGARADRGWNRLAPRFAALAALTLAAHLAVLSAEVHTLRAEAAAREAEVRTALEARLGTLPEALPIEAALGRALPSSEPQAPRLLPRLAQTSEALLPLADKVGFRSLDFAGSGALTLVLEAGGLAALQQAERALAGAGLPVAAGAASTGDGAAEARFVIGDRQ